LIHLRATGVKAAGNNLAGKAKASGLGLTASYRYALGGDMAVAARLGVASMKGEFTPASGGAGASSTTTQALAGLSLSFDLSKTVTARLDWDGTRARMANEAGAVNLLSASVLLRF
jgi:hypothetical protein